MAALIDTSVLIAAERGAFDLKLMFAEHPDDQFGISSITATELLHGVLRARTAKLRERRQAFVESIFDGLPVLAFDLYVARVHAALWAELASKGALVGERDLMIAATAIAHGLQIMTLDLRSFPRVPGISTIRL